jgi:hypothetical protein
MLVASICGNELVHMHLTLTFIFQFRTRVDTVDPEVNMAAGSCLDSGRKPSDSWRTAARVVMAALWPDSYYAYGYYNKYINYTSTIAQLAYR